MKISEKLCWFLAALCLLLGTLMQYIFTAVRFTGFLFWCAAAVLVVFALLTRWREERCWALWARRGLLALLAAGFAFFAVLECRVLSWARTDNETPVSAIIVLGAGVDGRTPSLSLRTRLDAVLAYVQDKPEVPIVVSGSQGRGEEISEARCMYDWLTVHGVPPERIILEERATNTEENIRYSLELLEKRDVAGNIAVVSSDYHLCRAAMHLGGDMVPVAARMPAQYLPLTVNYYIREAFGIAAEMFF
ncbi:MAG: YdcF family protein [Oscillospiraceae bacterium]|nr:YdcF family protein [Oscillospiraceae bacterium]